MRDVKRPGSASSRVQASQQPSTMASKSANSRCDRKRSRRWSQTRSTGFQLRAVGRQVDQADAIRDPDGVGGVPACLVHQQGGMHAGREALGEVVKEDLHGGRVGVGQHQGESVVGAGAHGAIQPGRGVSPVQWRTRPLATLEPDAGAAAFLPDPGLVFAPELQFHAGMSLGDGAQDPGETPFLKAIW